MAQAPLHKLRTKLNPLENIRVRLETNECAVGFVVDFALLLLLQLALLEPGFHVFAAAMAADQELPGQGVDGLGADPVQADAELKHVVVVLRAGVDLGHAVHHLAQRDAAAEIPHAHGGALNVDLHLPAVAHDVFVNGVVDHLLEQDVAAVIVVRTIAETADIHAGAQPDMLQRGKCLDLALVVIVFYSVGHSRPSSIQRIGLFANTEIGADW